MTQIRPKVGKSGEKWGKKVLKKKQVLPLDGGGHGVEGEALELPTGPTFPPPRFAMHAYLNIL